MNAFVQRLGRVVIEHRNGLLPDDRSGIHARIHEMDRASGHFYAMFQRLAPSLEARE